MQIIEIERKIQAGHQLATKNDTTGHHAQHQRVLVGQACADRRCHLTHRLLHRAFIVNDIGAFQHCLGFLQIHSGLQIFQIGVECRADLGVAPTEIDSGLQVAELGTAIVADAVVTVGQHLLFAE